MSNNLRDWVNKHLKEGSTQNTTLACWNRYSSKLGENFFFSHKKFLFITLGFLPFSLYYAHLIHDVTVGDLDLNMLFVKRKTLWMK